MNITDLSYHNTKLHMRNATFNVSGMHMILIVIIVPYLSIYLTYLTQSLSYTFYLDFDLYTHTCCGTKYTYNDET